MKADPRLCLYCDNTLADKQHTDPDHPHVCDVCLDTVCTPRNSAPVKADPGLCVYCRHTLADKRHTDPDRPHICDGCMIAIHAHRPIALDKHEQPPTTTTATP